MILHGALPSPFVRKVVIAFEEMGVAYERKDAAPFPKDELLLSRSPLGKIPYLEDDGVFIPDSSVICAYGARLAPGRSVYPDDPKAFARALFLEEYSDTRAVEALGTIFFERYVKPNVFQQETDEAVVAEALEQKLPPVLDYLEAQLDGKDTLLGEFSIADCAFGGHIAGFRVAGIELDEARWPGVASYRQSLMQRDSVKAALPG